MVFKLTAKKILISFSSAYLWGCSCIWWQRLPHKVPTAHQSQFLGSVSCSTTLQHVAQFQPRGARIWTSDFLITSQRALPTELQPPILSRHDIMISDRIAVLWVLEEYCTYGALHLQNIVRFYFSFKRVNFDSAEPEISSFFITLSSCL